MKRGILSSALALTLAIVAGLGLGASAAFAETSYTAIGGSTTITKNLVVDSDANIPDIEFAYTITREDAAEGTSSTIGILQSPVAATIGKATFGNADTASAIAGLPSDADPTVPTAGKKYAQKTVDVTFPAGSFTQPGVYRYKIVESHPAKPGVVYDANPDRYLDVFVVADASDVLTVDSYVLRDSATTIGTDGHYTTDPTAKSAGYTNTITQYDFSFSKVIAGNQGDKNKRFTFTLSVSNAIPGVYPVQATDVTGNPSTITVGTDGTATGTFDLTNGSSLKVLGLNASAVCTVSEDQLDYTATHAVDTDSSVSGSSSGAITLDADHSVAFTNTRNGIIPTGVIVTVAPFVIGILLAAAVILYVVARRRKRDFA